MPRTREPKSAERYSYLEREDVLSALLPAQEPADPQHVLREVAIADLWLDDQPRRLVPDELFQALVAAGRAQPGALLEALQEVAGERPYYQGVLDRLTSLAATIGAEGVLQPLIVTAKEGLLVVRDGHRRTLASLLAGRPTVPVRVLDEVSAAQAASRQLVLNMQREEMTALEKARWLLRLALLVEQEVRTERGLGGGAAVIAALAHRAPGEGGSEEEAAATPEARKAAAEVRERILGHTGLHRATYYRLLALNGLSPAAQEAGQALTEGQLRPVTALSPEEQGEIVAFIARRGLSSAKAEELAKVARTEGVEAARQVMAALARRPRTAGRTGVSWEGLLHALPADQHLRFSALRAELAVLAPPQRAVRLAQLHNQRALAVDYARQVDDILALYGPPTRDEA